MQDYLPYIFLFAVLCVVLYLYLKRPHERRADAEEIRPANHQTQDPHAWTLRVIKTGGHNTDGSSRPLLIEALSLQDTVFLQYSLEEKSYEVQNRRHQTLGYLPHNSTDRVRMYQAAGRIGNIAIKQKGGSVEHPELVLEIEVKP
ncbi:MAG: hypothetical protein WBL80_06200 [Erysipelotrichaceae bacterium]